MEAEERPTKLRKLSHDLSLSEIPTTRSEAADPTQTPARPELSVTQNHSASNSDSSSNILEIREPEATGTDPPRTAESETPTTTKDSAGQTPTTQGLSKNQLKKQKRKADWEAGREGRKALRRDKAKAKKARKREAREEALAKAAENGTPIDNVDSKDQDSSAWISRKNYKFHQRPRVRVPVAFVLDCSFDALMTEKEIISLGSQLTRCYSDNTKAPFSAHFYISSWTPDSELRKRFEGLMRGTYKNWKGIAFTESDFVEAGKMAHSAMTGPKAGKTAGVFEKYLQKHEDNAELVNPPTAATNGHTNQIKTEPAEQPNLPSTDTDQPPATAAPSVPPALTIPIPTIPQLVYLTSDSPHTLSHLSPHTTYVIGGLVDKNRHKSLCYQTAVRLGIPTAKLPLATYMKMTSREVLATNHVMEIMLRWLEVGDWGDAFLEVLPKRKGAILRGDEGDNDKEGGRDEKDDDGGHDSYDGENDHDHDDGGDSLDDEEDGGVDIH